MANAGPRPDTNPPYIFTDERATLLAFLGYLRESVVAKLAGLTEEQARWSPVPTGTSLLGLVKHLTIVELGWFVWCFAGEDLEVSPADQALAADDHGPALVTGYREACRRADAVVAGCADLERRAARVRGDRELPTLRWILVHMVEETGRHAGHADILREQLDGATGR